MAQPPSPPPSPLHRPHSVGFARSWRELVIDALRLGAAGRFAQVPSLLPPGRSVLSYLPLLNYTDVTLAEADDLVREAGGRPYLIRVLDPAASDPQPNHPVAARLVLAGRDEEQILMRVIKPPCRRKLKQAWRADYTVEESEDPEVSKRLHRFLADTLQRRHGIPSLPAHFFAALADTGAIDARFIIVSLQGRPVAGMVLIFDEGLAWVPWMAADPAAFAQSPNHLLYWRAVTAARARGCDILDFGRSSYGSPTWRFKSQWGCAPVPVALLAPKPVRIYEKYAWATRVWRHLPTAVARPAGAWLSRHLADL